MFVLLPGDFLDSLYLCTVFLKVRSDDTAVMPVIPVLGRLRKIVDLRPDGLHKKVPGHPGFIDPIC